MFGSCLPMGGSFSVNMRPQKGSSVLWVVAEETRTNCVNEYMNQYTLLPRVCMCMCIYGHINECYFTHRQSVCVKEWLAEEKVHD